MTLISKYKSQSLHGTFHYELFEDRIRVKGSNPLGVDVDYTLPLAGLNRQTMRFRFRNSLFQWGLGLFGAGFILYTLLVHEFRFDPFGMPAGMIGCMALAGAIISLVTLKKNTFVYFTNAAQQHVLAIGRDGPDHRRFDEFIELIKKQIPTPAGPTASPDTPPPAPPDR